MKAFILISISLLASMVNGQNNKPVIMGNDFILCYGASGCIDITTSDADGDKVLISWNKGIPKGIFTQNNHAVNFASGKVCYTESEYNMDTVREFIITATDGKDTVRKTFKFWVKWHPSAYPKIKKWGNKFDIDLTSDTTKPWNKYGPVTFDCVARDSNGNVFYTGTNSKFTVYAPPSQRIDFTFTYKTATCQYIRNDTMISGLALGAGGLKSIASVYPNPASGQVTLAYNYQPGDIVTITDITGKAMINGFINGTSQEIDILHLTNGMYFISITNTAGELIAIQKFLKE